MPRSEDGQYEMVLENRQVLMIFFAAAALCGVFFALGYLVGKNSGSAYTPPVAQTNSPTVQEGKRPAPVEPVVQAPATSAEPKKEEPAPATTASATPPAKTEAEPPKTQAPAPKKEEPPPAPAPAPTKTAAAPAAESFITLQVAALSKREDAEAMVALLKRKNFPVSLVTNSPDNLFRVQVGPYPSVKDAEYIKGRLEQEGFKPIVKK